MKERKFLLVSALFSRQHYSHTKEAYARIKDTCTRTKETYSQVKSDQYHINECKTKNKKKGFFFKTSSNRACHAHRFQLEQHTLSHEHTFSLYDTHT